MLETVREMEQLELHIQEAQEVALLQHMQSSLMVMVIVVLMQLEMEAQEVTDPRS